MAMDDLFEALKMFTQGAKELQTSRAISSANEYVQQVKASELSDQQKRAELQNVSNQLVSHLAGMGTPATTIAQVAGAIGPKQFANSNQMNLEGLVSGDTSLQAEAKQQQDFETNPKFELAKIRAAVGADPYKQAKFEEAKDQFTTRQFEKFSKTLDNTDAVRNAFGKTGQGIQRANQIMALIGNADNNVKAANNLPPQMVYEMAASLASMVKGGQQPTIDDINHFMVNSLKLDKAKAQQYLTSGVSGAEAAPFVQLYAKTAKRERAELQAQNDDTVLNRAQGNFSLYKRDPELFKRTLADRLNVGTDDIIVDEKKRLVTTRQRQEVDSKVDSYQGAAKEAMLAINSSDPAAQKKARMVLDRLGLKPGITLREAMEDIRYKVSRGLY